MKEKKPGFYFCDLWRMNYYFFVGWTFEDFCAYVDQNYSYKVDPKPEPVGKMLMLELPTGKTIVCIWTEKKSDYPSLAHECLHAANRTLVRAGVYADFYNDEAQAYLMTNLIRKALGR